jgi:predicted acylesterase/phospholipase RssA
MGERLKQYELANANVVILPEVGDLHWSSFSQAMNLIDEGEKAAREKLDEIRRRIPRLKRRSGFKKALKIAPGLTPTKAFC